MLVRTGNRSSMGSKAFDLYRLRLLGVNVPEYYVIPAEACSGAAEGKYDPSARGKLMEAFLKLGRCVSVRSSSVAEDLHGKSSAGRFKTVLGVDTFNGLLEAVFAVRASADGNGMAVIIQRQLKPERAGVLFTRNPVTGAREIVIEQVSGLADKLVSGKVEPERFIIKNNNKIKSERTNKKKFRPLIKLAMMIETNFGYPIDIEWAYCRGQFHILQARPITGLPPLDKNSCRTYSRVQAEQFYSGPVSPMFFSIFNELYSKYYVQETIGLLGLDLKLERVMLKHKSHLYVDTAFTEYALTHLPIREGREHLLEIFPEDIRTDIRNRRIRTDPIAVVRILKLLMFRPKLWFTNLDRCFENEVVPELYKRLDELKDFNKLDNSELAGAFQDLMDAAVLHIRTSKWGLALYIIPMIGAVKRFLEKNGYGDDQLSVLMSGLPVNMTMDASAELKKMADIIKNHTEAVKILSKKSTSYDKYRKRLLTVPAGAYIVDYFEAILKKFGHRRLSRDIMTQSWNDEPMIPFTILRKLVLDNDIEQGGPLVNTYELRLKLEKKIKDNLSAFRRWKFGVIVKFMVRYVSYREYQRFFLDMVLSRMRALLVEVSGRMVRDGKIKDETSIFFLEISDVMDYLNGKGQNGLKKKSEFNRLTFEDERSTPGRYLRLGVDFESLSSPEDTIFTGTGDVISGQGVSPGSYTGRVRVIENIDNNVEIEAGEIIVTKCIDPGQTHIFLLAGGLVLESGGMLSHGAILAREFNIPTVAGIKNATGIFKNQQMLSVNGTRGEVVQECI